MKVQITLTDQNGAVYQGDAQLVPVAASLKGNTRATPVTKSKRPTNGKVAPPVDFDVNERAFMKAHGRGLSGPKKFVLLAAYMVKGRSGAEVELGEVLKRWNRMKSLLGKFNLSYTNRAKENGWVNPREKGVYVLTSSWKGALT
jgi:hypothetical protein